MKTKNLQKTTKEKKRRNLSTHQRSSIENRRKLALSLNSIESLEDLRPQVMEMLKAELEDPDTPRKDKLQTAKALLPYMFATKRENVNVSIRIEDLVQDMEEVKAKVINEDEG